MLAQKQKLVDILRSRGQSDRADWVARDLPDEFDIGRHRGLLDLLRIAPDELVEVGSGPQPGPGEQSPR